MRLSLAVSFTLIAAAAAGANEGLYASATSAVTSLTTKFEVPFGPGEHQLFVLVEFYSSWCGHCQHFAPIYESIAIEAGKSIPRLKVAAVNCVTHEDICQHHSINGYPTLVLYPGEHKFKGQNSLAGVMAFVKEHASAEQLAPLPKPTPTDAYKIAAAANAHAAGILHDANASSLAKVGAALQMGMQHDAAMHNAAAVAGAQALAAGKEAFAAAASARPWLGMKEAGNELAAAAKMYGIPDADEGSAKHPMLKPRPMPMPVPQADVLAAARYSLYHDVANALSSTAAQAYPRKRLGALRGWLHALHRALPHDKDGGAASVGAGELLAGLHGRTDLPNHDEWMTMLEHSGLPDAPDEWQGCNSSRPDLHAYPCSLWLLFHTLVAQRCVVMVAAAAWPRAVSSAIFHPPLLCSL